MSTIYVLDAVVGVHAVIFGLTLRNSKVSIHYEGYIVAD